MMVLNRGTRIKSSKFQSARIITDFILSKKQRIVLHENWTKKHVAYKKKLSIPFLATIYLPSSQVPSLWQKNMSKTMILKDFNVKFDRFFPSLEIRLFCSKNGVVQTNSVSEDLQHCGPKIMLKHTRGRTPIRTVFTPHSLTHTKSPWKVRKLIFRERPRLKSL